MKILIKPLDGIKYSKISQDFNKIHIDNKYAANSLFGEMVCHGCYVLNIVISKNSKLKKMFNMKKFNLKAEFNDGIFYNKYFFFQNIGNRFFLTQDKIKKLNLVISNLNENEITISKRKTKISMNINTVNKKKTLFSLLNRLSYYVGMIYPGKDSIIKSISINFNIKKIFSSDSSIIIYSKKKNSRYPLINNTLVYKNYLINFESLFRPKFTINKTKPSNSLIDNAKSIRSNILIIGASNGIGKEILDIFKHNKKIKIFATYNNNKIFNVNKNVTVIKYNVELNSKRLIDIIKKKDLKYIYYMATPRINLIKNIENKNYFNFYFKYPVNILKKIKKKNIFFYYPSSVFVGKKINQYTASKLIFEEYTKKKFKQLIINCAKLPEINTRQNINFLGKNFLRLQSY